MAVVVLSMHRSGTSALTRVLSLLGCALPRTLIASRENDNATGFWESQAVVDVNEDICASAGSNWNDWVSLSRDWLSSPDRGKFVDRACEALEGEFGDSRLFVLKDPRLCRLMPVWMEALERFGARPVYVLPVRNPFEVAASLRSRNQLIEGDSHLAWLRHMLDAERYSRGQPRVFLRYDDLLGNWRKVVERISNRLELTWPNQPAVAEEAIDGFLAHDLRHQHVEDTRVLEDTRLSPWVRQCYDVMSRWTRDEIRDDDMETLDRIDAEMNAVVPAFEGIIAEARALGKECKALARRLKAADATREAPKAVQGERDQSMAELTRLRDRLSQTDGELTRQRAELVEATSELEKLRAELAERDEQLRDLDAQRVSEREEARLAIYHVSQEASSRLAEQETELAKIRAKLGRLRRGSAEITAQARSLLNDYMKNLYREVHRPGPRIFPRLDLLKRSRRRETAEELRKFAEELRRSAYFDAEWYLARNTDVAKAGMDPALHFIEHGFREGRAPNARLEKSR